METFFCFNTVKKNTSKERIINRTPYEAVLGPIKCGLSTASIPAEIQKKLHSEEGLEEVLADLNQQQLDVSEESSQQSIFPSNHEELCASCRLQIVLIAKKFERQCVLYKV